MIEITMEEAKNRLITANPGLYEQLFYMHMIQYNGIQPKPYAYESHGSVIIKARNQTNSEEFAWYSIFY